MSRLIRHNILKRMFRPEHALSLRLSLGAGLLLTTSCTGGSDSRIISDSLPEDAIVIAGDSVLTRREVETRIPYGTTPEDSAALFHSIVDGWLEKMLLTHIAEQNVEDMEEIDRLVEDYRKKLIIANYRRKLRESGADGIDSKAIDAYYSANADEMILDAPVVKGLYVKLPTDASRLADIRRWMMTATPDAVDNLEKYGLNEAIEYSFFEDKWIDWPTIARQIPYKFGDPDEFVSRRRNFETSYRGFTYLLHITESLPSGEKMPKEVAEPFIRERLSTESGDRYERNLIGKIYRQAIKEGRLKIVNYDGDLFPE